MLVYRENKLKKENQRFKSKENSIYKYQIKAKGDKEKCIL